MQMRTLSNQLRLTRPEICFFLIVFVAFPVVTDIEYALNREPGDYLSAALVLNRIVYGFLQAIPFVLYYKRVLPYLFRRRYLRFIALLVLFLSLLDLYTKYGVYGLLMKASFLPQTLTDSARTGYNADVMLHYSFAYVVRELLVVSVLGYYFQSIRQQQQIDQLRQVQLQAELSYLKAQIQPHFFFNTLNNIYSLALEQSGKTAPLVAKHAEMMRYILYQAEQPTVNLVQEVEFLSSYVAVETVRYSDKIAIRFDTQGIEPSVRIEPLLLLPFVENTFKHGVSEETGTGYVHIALVMIDQGLMLETKNSKVTLSSDHDQPKGIGLINVQKRLALLYPGQHELTIREDAITYELQLRLRLRNHD